ncbi:MAG TPA: mechanosensitive ion channel family protein [Puia sp.]|jgi:small-conductance mechanosensitive channel
MKRIYLIVVVLCLFHSGLLAQGQNRQDSVKRDSIPQDSSHIAEKLILQHQEQYRIDSAIRQQIQTELNKAVGDAAKTRELQAQLHNISARDSMRREEQAQRIEQLKKNARGFPVILNDDTLFLLYTKVGSFGPQERALAISQRISKLYKNYLFLPDSMKLVATESGYDIVYKGDMDIMSIAQLDALWLNTTADSLSRTYYSKIIAVVEKERQANSLQSWLKRLGLMVLVIGGVILLISMINKLFRRSASLIVRNKTRYLNGLTIRKIRLFSAEKFEQFALGVNNVVRIVIIVLSIYLGLLLLSSIFTVTERWTDILLSWILTPARSALHGIVNFLPNLFTILVIYFIFRYAIKAVKYFSNEIQRGHIELKGFHREWAHPTYNIVKFLMYAFMVILIFPYLPGSSSPAFKGVSVFLGILFSLGSSSAITNMVAGLVITYMRPFKIGDRVKIGEVTGDVLEKNMLVTRIRTIKNEEITVPNSMVLSSSTVNYSANTAPEDTGLILHTTVTIGYDVPWKKMHQALIDAAMRTELILKEPDPFVLQTSLDDFFVSYQLNAYTREANKQASIYSALHQNIQDCCNEAGIEIMSPHYRAMRDGNTTTIPSDYLPKDYQAKN